MTSRRRLVLALWLTGLAAALWMVVHARYITDLSAFLPARPTPLQKLLVDQLRDGPASRLILIALEHGDAKTRARMSEGMAHRLRSDPQFSNVDNGGAFLAERDRDFLFQHRYVLSDAVEARRFSADGLRAAITQTIEDLASSAGLMVKSLVARDPTGEMQRIIEQLAHEQGPLTRDGVWVSADGTRTLLVAQTRAAGSDTDSQERDLGLIREAFQASAGGAGPQASVVKLRTSGPGVFAVAARDKIKRAATRLSLLSGMLVIAVLLTVYRSPIALGLGLLPVATGALCGIAAVDLGFGVVHGITLGFGVTLIGESVDYSIYFFIQSQQRNASGTLAPTWQQALWPTVRLGMLTSVGGFASLLPSAFPGLAQLGLYSISGLLAAGWVTRFVLPELLPHGFRIRDVSPLGRRIERLRDRIRGLGPFAIAAGACLIALIALSVLYRHREGLWNRELSALSPVAPADLAYDAKLRGDLGAASVLDIVVVQGRDLQAVLRGAERAAGVLRELCDAKVIADFDSPADYLPSLSTQQARRSALPDRSTLRDNLRRAVTGLGLTDEELSAFVADIGEARRAAPLAPEDLRGTSLSTAFNTLVLEQADHWNALLPLRAAAADRDIDVARVAAAFAAAHLTDVQVLDMKVETDALYGGYLKDAIRLSAYGFALIVVLLLLTLRSPLRVARVLAPLALAVLSVAAALAQGGQRLNLLHLVGMLLIVAVGSNYALFFDNEARQPGATSALTLASLAIANLSTVIAFGLLAFSQVPVLEALGTTVAPGALLALVFSALMTAPASQPAATPADA